MEGVIKFEKELEAQEALNKLEYLCKPLHKIGDLNYTYLIDNSICIELKEPYTKIVEKWILENNYIVEKYEPKIIVENE